MIFKELAIVTHGNCKAWVSSFANLDFVRSGMVRIYEDGIRCHKELHYIATEMLCENYDTQKVEIIDAEGNGFLVEKEPGQ